MIYEPHPRLGLRVGLDLLSSESKQCQEECFLLVSEGERERLILHCIKIISFRYQSFGFSKRCFEGKSLY